MSSLSCRPDRFPIPKNNMKEALIMFGVQVVSYLLLVLNFRAIAQTNYITTAWTDFLFASLTFFVFKRMIKHGAENVGQWLGYALGGVVGSLLGIWLSHTYLS